MQIFELIFCESEKWLLTYLPSINNSFLLVPHLVKLNNFFWSVHPGWLFGKTLWSIYPCHQSIETEELQGFSSTSIIEFCSIVGSIEIWGEQSMFYFWSYLVVACHKLSHFSSQVLILGFTWYCYRLQEAKKFTRSPGQSKCVTRVTRYHTESLEPSCRISPRPGL